MIDGRFTNDPFEKFKKQKFVGKTTPMKVRSVIYRQC